MGVSFKSWVLERDAAFSVCMRKFLCKKGRADVELDVFLDFFLFDS